MHKIVYNTVVAIISEQMNIDILDVTDDLDLRNDLGCDSLDVCQIHMDIEKQYGIIIEECEFNRARRVKEIVSLIERKINV